MHDTAVTWGAVTWGIATLATGGVIVRPWRVPEFVWAVAGAVLLVVGGLLPPDAALTGVAKGTDVYLFLLGMMLLAEIARQEALFDWLAEHAAARAKGSAARMFTLIYLVGTVVTVFLSNDATAVVLTPAVAAATRSSGAAEPLPFLLICAFIANAASFVLPISNPANLVIYGNHMPRLTAWLPLYALPSVLAIAATYLALRLSQRRALRQSLVWREDVPALTGGGCVAAAGIVGTAVALMVASAAGWPLGMPTCLAGLATMAAVVLRARRSPWDVVRAISWGVLPLVAGLFVIVAALDRTGLIQFLVGLLGELTARSQVEASWITGITLALACNLTNNLPAGLIAGTVVQAAHAPVLPTGATLIGVDLGPNLSVTGSLATILWLAALRREGLQVDAWSFLRLGIVVMPPALLLALGGLVVWH